MNIKELLTDSSKLTALHAANVAIQKLEIIPLLIDLASMNVPHYSRRVANVIEIIDSINTGLIQPFYQSIIHVLLETSSEGVKRCFLKMLCRHTDQIKEDILCDLMNFCFKWLLSVESEVAVKVYSMEILHNISKIEPDLKNELILVIQYQLPVNSPAFKAKGNHILKKLYKETRQLISCKVDKNDRKLI